MNPKTRNLLASAAITATALGAALALYLGNRESPVSGAHATPERKVLYWHDPMAPGTRFDKPGKSPFMDMALVPVYEDAALAEGTLSIRPEVINNLGVRTYTVERAARGRTLTTQGYVVRNPAGSGLTVLADVFERDTAWLKPGLPARVRTNSGSANGMIVSVGSDEIAGSGVKLVVRLRDTRAALRPGDFAEVAIETPAGSPGLFVPREALIRTGSRTALMLALGEGRFRPVDVVAGEERGEWIEIRSGIEAGDTIVTSGQFLLDSEASLRASFQRMNSNAP